MANFIKISNNTTSDFIDSQNFGKKFIINAKVPFTIGNDATQNFEYGIKVVSAPLPAQKKLKLLKASFNYNCYFSVTETSVIYIPFAENALPVFNGKQYMCISNENINNFYTLGAGIPPSFQETSEKFYTMLPYEMLANKSNVKIFNSELIQTNKLSYLNIVTRFGFTPAMDDGDFKTALLSYVKLNFDSGASAAAMVQFEYNMQIEFEVFEKEKRKPLKQTINIKKTLF